MTKNPKNPKNYNGPKMTKKYHFALLPALLYK